MVIRLRQKAGMTQQELTHISGVSLASITRVEKGESCRTQTAIAILHAFQPLEDADLVDAAMGMQLAPHVLARKLDLHAHRVLSRPPAYRPPVSSSRATPAPFPTDDVLDDIRESHGNEGLRGALAAMEAMAERLREMLDENEKPDEALTLVDRQQRNADGANYVEETRRTYSAPTSQTAKDAARAAGKALAKKAQQNAEQKAQQKVKKKA